MRTTDYFPFWESEESWSGSNGKATISDIGTETAGAGTSEAGTG